MHSIDEIELHDITKVEGHASLYVKLKGKKVESCEFRIAENQRFFEQIVVGKHFTEIPIIVSRICGLCSQSHLSTAIKAVEDALSIEVSEQTKLLRELATNAEFLKSHALHLFFLALPDYFGKESFLKFNKKEHVYIHLGLDLKKAGTDMLRCLGALPYHTVNIRVGGFSKLPEQRELGQLLHALEKHREKAIQAIGLFASLKTKFEFSRETPYVALTGENYSLQYGKILCSDGTVVEESSYLKHFQEFIVPYSTAKQALFGESDYFVGALARVNLNQKGLCPAAKRQIKELKLKFPTHNRFYNNMAQALELLQCIESSISILKDLKLRKESIPEIKLREASGVGVTEAPRGTLYHCYSVNKEGYIHKANIIVPTLQFARSIELDLAELIPEKLKLPRQSLELEIEKLIRAYDPCISCSTHFLKVKWE